MKEVTAASSRLLEQGPGCYTSQTTPRWVSILGFELTLGRKRSPGPSMVNRGQVSFPEETVCLRCCASAYSEEVVCDYVCMCVASPF